MPLSDRVPLEQPCHLVPPDQRFPVSERLKRPRDFDTAIRTGTFYRNHLLTVVVASGPAAVDGVGARRLGVSVGKRVGGAVLRNRVKRRLRALYVEHRHLLPPQCDCVIIAKPPVAKAPTRALRKSIHSTFSRAGSGRSRRRRRLARDSTQ